LFYFQAQRWTSFSKFRKMKPTFIIKYISVEFQEKEASDRLDRLKKQIAEEEANCKQP
jgi:hypothetical protein